MVNDNFGLQREFVVMLQAELQQVVEEAGAKVLIPHGKMLRLSWKFKEEEASIC